VKLTKCRICRTPFKKLSIKHKDCSPACAIEGVKRDKTKKARKEHLAAKVRLRSRREWMKLAQMAFNGFIRKRDEGLTCISCGRHHTGQYQAGHYMTAGAHPELRFDEANCHKQCVPCNNHLSGNIVNYRPRLIVKIGLAEVERLEGPNEPKKWNIPDLQEIIRVYKLKTKQITQEG
jgi:hypothetical protein